MRRPARQYLHPLLETVALGFGGLIRLPHRLELVLRVALSLRRSSQERLELAVLLLEGGVLAQEALQGRDGRLGEMPAKEEVCELLVEIFSLCLYHLRGDTTYPPDVFRRGGEKGGDERGRGGEGVEKFVSVIF